MNTIDKYIQKKSFHQEKYKQIKKKYNLISILRLCIALSIAAFIFLFFKTDNTSFLWAMLGSFILFVFIMKWHQKVAFKKILTENLILINQDEILFIKEGVLPFNNGLTYLPNNHDFAYDLDFFGEKSIFHHLNRTGTYKGEEKLALNLLKVKDVNIIIETQDAIKELAEKLDFRQNIYAFAKMTADSEITTTNLISWSKIESERNSTILKYLSYIFPLIFIICFILTFLEINPIFSKIASFLFFINLTIMFSKFKKITKEINNLSKITAVINNYSLIIAKIESEIFQTKKLQDLQKKLFYNSKKTSQQINELSSLAKQLESILNPFAFVVANGMFLSHLHSYRNLINWKNNFSKQIPVWMEIIATFESLNSLANFSYNNPTFCFPKINEDLQISLKDVGHPLINSKNRVNNDIDFNSKQFIILTGSNMSGKSTFLRSLGINMVFAGIGMPVCAKEANIHPLQVLVSMRLSDSVTENESYFFAEVKRLKEIMNKLDNKRSFVLLDEILRGTNSDDKRVGTIEVIKKMIEKNAIGSIATHDLEVCNTTNEFPEILTNKNFEVEIINNELVFDYKLREGVCKNKSATFLMKKMEVI